MPHLILEISQNLDAQLDSKKLFDTLKQLLVGALPTELSSFKCRLYVADEISIGDEVTNQAFAHLTIKILPGRDQKKLNEVVQKCYSTMKQVFDNAFSEFNIKQSVELIELSQFYVKN